ncbi:hypothetical protein F5877DRAFT_63360 [Lentinula edodes]|nr:hypothetical protein F5877DRAFT_63360 [Lentinula edodes]
MQGESEFMRPMQQLTTEVHIDVGWGTIWSRPGLEPKQRSLINLALLAFQAKKAEVRVVRIFAAEDALNHFTARRPYTVDHVDFLWKPSSSTLCRGAVKNGASEIEIRETLLHTSVYPNTSSAEFRMEAFRVADEAVTKLKEEGLLPK